MVQEELSVSNISSDILWVDDDPGVLDSAARLLRRQPWQLFTASSVGQAQDILLRESVAVVIADQGLPGEKGVDLLAFAKTRSPASTRILLTGAVSNDVINEAVNLGHVFRFVSKPWVDEELIAEVSRAIEYHQLKVNQSTLFQEVRLQNRKLEQLTSGLERLVLERTHTVEQNKVQAEKKLAKVRSLVRFIKDLSLLTSVEELMGLMRKELRQFHEVRSPVLTYFNSEGQPKILHFRGQQVIESYARKIWSAHSRLRINEYEDRIYLANEFGRPFVRVLALPLRKRVGAMNNGSEVPATLFFEHTLAESTVENFLAFVSERLQPLSIALDRILLEVHLKYTSLQWERTFDGIGDPIAIIDIDYNIVRANRKFIDAGITHSGGGYCHQLFAGRSEVCRGCPVAEALQTGLPQKGQIKQNERVYEVLSYPIRLQGDRASTNVINHYVDVTRARDLHSRMIQSEKMAAVGRLAGHIAHELNNPLTGIRSLCQVLAVELPVDQQQLRDDFVQVEKAAERSQKIIENLLEFSKGEGEHLATSVSLDDIVKRTLPMLKAAMTDHRCEIHLSEEPTHVRVEPHLMQQVVFNLVNNACQSMTNAGTITVETKVFDDELGKKRCALLVSDTGSGISPEHCESVFEPFFTTKKAGQGTGLGLSMSRSVIQRFGGDIKVNSEVGVGTCFTVTLPAAVDSPISEG